MVNTKAVTGDTTTIGAPRQVISNQGIDRRTFSRIPTVLEMPNLVQVQLQSFDWFVREGLRELLEEISPITDHHKKMELSIFDPRFDEPWQRMPKGEAQERAKIDSRVAEIYCRERDITYAAPLRVSARLVMKETGEIKETGPDGIFLGDFPMMSTDGTFVINGAERVVVSQLVRSPGVYFERTPDPATGKLLSTAKLIPNRGAWLEFETSNRDILSVKVDRKRRMPVTILLRALGYSTDEQLVELFRDVDTDEQHRYVTSTLEKEPLKGTTDEKKGRDEALLELYKRIRPGDPPTRENAENLLKNLFFFARRYDLAKVGRYKLNKRLSLDALNDTRVLTNEDIVEIVKTMIRLNNGNGEPDDIDHLGNR